MGEGECAVFMKTLILGQREDFSPPLSLLNFDNGGDVPLLGQRGSNA